jgi:hypothetical protein
MPEPNPIPPNAQTSETAEAVEAVEIPETPKEHAPMIDVHMPHETHTWKDFWIHLGTIAVGLLIAISLEQSVEALHRLHERHVLEDELRLEGEDNKTNAEIDVVYYDARVRFLLGLRGDIDTMIATGGKANLPFRAFQAPPAGHGMQPGTTTLNLNSTVWDTAKADGRLALLPDAVKKTFGVLYHHKAQWDERQASLLVMQRRRTSFQGQFSDLATPTVPVFSRMSEAELRELRGLVMDDLVETGSLRGITLTFLGDSNLVFNAALSYDAKSAERAIVKAEEDAAAAHRPDYIKMAKEIEAEDAARDKAAAKPAAKGLR